MSLLARPALALTVGALVLSACGSPGPPDASQVVGPRPLAVAAAGPEPVTAWPAASGSAGRTSPAVAVGPQTGRVRWTRALEGAVVPGPAVGIDGSIIAASNGGVLHALDPSTGADRWTLDGGGGYGSDLSTTPAVLADGTILWPGPGSALIAVSKDGQRLWDVELSGFVLSPAVVGDRVYVGDQSGRLLALQLGAGPPTTLWDRELGGSSFTSPAVGPDGMVVTAHDDEVVALRPDGDVAWRFRARDTIETSVAVGPDGLVVVGTNSDDEIGLNADGSVRWRFPKGDWSYSSPVVARGSAWFGDHLGYLDQVDARTGRLIRRNLGIPRDQGRTSAGTGFWTAPLVDAAGNAYGGTAAGHVYGFGADGRRLWDADLGSVVASYPALTGDGTLVIGSTDGVLHAFHDAR